MKIADIGPLEAIKTLLPYFVTAGKVACRIQDDIGKNGNAQQEMKTGDRFTEVLTDADIAVETYLGTQILATFEDAAFYGEEHERDRVSNYFPKDAPYLVTLDPIDGTLYFKDGLPIFSVILTICIEWKIVASIVYIPCEGRFYLAVKDEGAWTTTAQEVGAGREPEPFHLAGRGKVVLVGTEYRDKKASLEENGFEVITPSLDYDGSKGWRKTSLNIFSGEVAGLAFQNAQLIDAGAIGFIATVAGGKDNGPVYDPGTKRADSLIVGANPETYDSVVAGLDLDR